MSLSAKSCIHPTLQIWNTDIIHCQGYKQYHKPVHQFHKFVSTSNNPVNVHTNTLNRNTAGSGQRRTFNQEAWLVQYDYVIHIIFSSWVTRWDHWNYLRINFWYYWNGVDGLLNYELLCRLSIIFTSLTSVSN